MKRSLLVLLPLLLVVPATAAPETAGAAAAVATPPLTLGLASSEGKPATLRLHLFVEGRIVAIEDGREIEVATWPTSIAPILPPTQTARGFVGFATGRHDPLDLWRVTGDGAEPIARGVTPGLAFGPGGRRTAYGTTDYTSLPLRTRLHVSTGEGDPVTARTIVDGMALPRRFVGGRVLVTLGDAVAIEGMWDPGDAPGGPRSSQRPDRRSHHRDRRAPGRGRRVLADRHVASAGPVPRDRAATLRARDDDGSDGLVVGDDRRDGGLRVQGVPREPRRNVRPRGSPEHGMGGPGRVSDRLGERSHVSGPRACPGRRPGRAPVLDGTGSVRVRVDRRGRPGSVRRLAHPPSAARAPLARRRWVRVLDLAGAPIGGRDRCLRRGRHVVASQPA